VASALQVFTKAKEVACYHPSDPLVLRKFPLPRAAKLSQLPAAALFRYRAGPPPPAAKVLDLLGAGLGQPELYCRAHGASLAAGHARAQERAVWLAGGAFLSWADKCSGLRGQEGPVPHNFAKVDQSATRDKFKALLDAESKSHTGVR
jgi:hypothetical protein